MSDLRPRAATALVGAAVAVGALWLGGWPFALFMGAVAVAAQFELYGLLAAGGARPLVAPGLGLGLAAAVWPVYPPAWPILAVGAALLPVAVLFTRRETPLLDAAGTALGVVYPAGLVSGIVALRLSDADWLAAERFGADGAFWLSLAVVFTVWASDTFAYTAGRAVGRHPLFPRVSPKKTWEGSAGGALGALAMVALFKVLVLDALSWVDVVAVAIACGVVSQLGDLAESHFKRSVGVKDSASWLPGHGGLLDRIDAAVVAVALVAIYFEVTRGLL